MQTPAKKGFFFCHTNVVMEFVNHAGNYAFFGFHDEK
jgi:hypothetical protein